MHRPAPSFKLSVKKSFDRVYAGSGIIVTRDNHKRLQIPMKRDMDLIRLLLLEQEGGEKLPTIDEYAQPLVVYNLALMKDAGLIDAVIIPDMNGHPSAVSVHRLTWAGHDFLDASRDNKLWKLAKQHIIKPGASWTFSLLAEWLKQEAKRQIFGDTVPQ